MLRTSSKLLVRRSAAIQLRSSAAPLARRVPQRRLLAEQAQIEAKTPEAPKIEAPKQEEPKSAPAPKVSSVRSRLAAFLVGVAVTSIGGYYKLSEEISTAFGLVDQSVRGISNDVGAAEKRYKAKLAELEARIAALEAEGDDAEDAAPAAAAAEPAKKGDDKGAKDDAAHH